MLGPYRRKSKLGRDESRLGRIEELEDFLRLARCSPGSDGRKPVDLANKLRMSVRDTTPLNLPDRCAPGIAEAGTAGGPGMGDCGAEEDPGMITVGFKRGVAGVEGDGDADSTTHIR